MCLPLLHALKPGPPRRAILGVRRDPEVREVLEAEVVPPLGEQVGFLPW